MLPKLLNDPAFKYQKKRIIGLFRTRATTIITTPSPEKFLKLFLLLLWHGVVINDISPSTSLNDLGRLYVTSLHSRPSFLYFITSMKGLIIMYVCTHTYKYKMQEATIKLNTQMYSTETSFVFLGFQFLIEQPSLFHNRAKFALAWKSYKG